MRFQGDITAARPTLIARAFQRGRGRRAFPLAGLVLGVVLCTALLPLWARAAVSLPVDAWPEEGAVVRSLDIQVLQDMADDFDWNGLIRALLRIQPGEHLTRDRLGQRLDRLTYFSDAEAGVSSPPSASGIDLILKVAPYKRVKSVSVSGNFPLFDQEVRNVMSAIPGSFYRPRDLPEQEKRVRTLFQAQGYIDPRVDIESTRDERDGHYHLHVRIEKGPYYTVGDIRFTGNPSVDDARLKEQMSVYRSTVTFWKSRRFIEQTFREDVKRLRTYYRRQGYFDVQITSEIERRPAERIVVLRLALVEGPHYSVRFQGNQVFSESALKSDLVFTDMGNRGNIGLRRSIRALRERYLKAGYADISIRWEETAADAPTGEQRPITIIVAEGKRHIVTQLCISGNRALDDQVILGQMLSNPRTGFGETAYSADVLREDVESIRALYLQNGFLDPNLTEQVKIDPKTKQVRIDLAIEEGPQTRVSSVAIQGDSPLSARELTKSLRMTAHDPLQPYLVQSEENRLAGRISPLGYPYVQVDGEVNLSEDRRSAEIVYTVAGGPHVTIGRIFFTGNFRTRKSLLKKRFGLKENEDFDLTKVLEAQRRLRDLGVFNAVEVRSIGLKERRQPVHLLVETSEKKSYEFEIGGGYQSNKGPYLRGRISDGNFLGLNKEIWTGGEISDVGYRWDAGVANPNFFGTRIRADVGIYAEREELYNQAFGTQTLGGVLTFSRSLTARIAADLTGRYERREQYLLESTVGDEELLDPETLEYRNNVVITPAVRYDSRDSFIRPRKGFLAGFSVDVSRGLDNTVDNFIKYLLDVRGYHSVTPQLTLAARARYGYLQTYGTDAGVARDQLFFLGGTADVRGFDENLLRFDDQGDPVGGRQAINASLEMRYEMNKNFELALFLDTGAIRDVETDVGGEDDFRHAAGLGLRYLTPVGPIGLSYGHKLDRRQGESPGRFHFTIGYTF